MCAAGLIYYRFFGVHTQKNQIFLEIELKVVLWLSNRIYNFSRYPDIQKIKWSNIWV